MINKNKIKSILISVLMALIFLINEKIGGGCKFCSKLRKKDCSSYKVMTFKLNASQIYLFEYEN
jgi:hypothetical protein